MGFIITIDMDDNGKVKNVVTKRTGSFDVSISEYARVFDGHSHLWDKDSGRRLVALKMQERYATDKLKLAGHLYLNDVYAMLGLPKTDVGEKIGWIYDEKNPIGDNYVSFDIFTDRNHDFINGYKDSCILDFNVDGCVEDYLLR